MNPANDRFLSAKKLIWPWAIFLLSTLFYYYDYFLRVSPSVMVDHLMKVYNVDAGMIGVLSAFYFYAYMPMQIPTGILLDKHSPRNLLTISCGFCALGIFIFSYTTSLPVVFFARFLMGFGSAFALVGAYKLAAHWFPHERFGLIVGLITGLGTLGAVSADVILSQGINKYGVSQSLLITGVFGIILLVLIYLFVRDDPPWKKHVEQKTESWSHSWKQLIVIFSNWRYWVTGAVACLMYLPVSVFASLWGNDFIAKVYNLDIDKAARLNSLIFLGFVVGGPVAGHLSDHFKRRRWPVFVGTFAATVILLLVIYVTSIPFFIISVLLFMLGFMVGSQIPLYALGREISPRECPALGVAGINFIITIGAAFFQPAIGYLIDFFWDGSMLQGVPDYSIHTYQLALAILPIMSLISFILTFLIPETKCNLMAPRVKHSNNIQ
ncbi:MAG: MFS transporter [Thermodesulfobacteriota bacterium]